MPELQRLNADHAPAVAASVLSRFNLVFVEDATAELGYRVAQRVASCGVAIANVRQLCQLAVERHGLRTV